MMTTTYDPSGSWQPLARFPAHFRSDAPPLVLPRALMAPSTHSGGSTSSYTLSDRSTVTSSPAHGALSVKPPVLGTKAEEIADTVTGEGRKEGDAHDCTNDVAAADAYGTDFTASARASPGMARMEAEEEAAKLRELSRSYKRMKRRLKALRERKRTMRRTLSRGDSRDCGSGHGGEEGCSDTDQESCASLSCGADEEEEGESSGESECDDESESDAGDLEDSGEIESEDANDSDTNNENLELKSRSRTTMSLSSNSLSAESNGNGSGWTKVVGREKRKQRGEASLFTNHQPSKRRKRTGARMGALLRRASRMTALHHPQPQQQRPAAPVALSVNTQMQGLKRRRHVVKKKEEEEEDMSEEGSEGGLFGHLHASDSEAEEMGSEGEGPALQRGAQGGEEDVSSPWVARKRFLIIPLGRFDGQGEKEEETEEEKKKDERKSVISPVPPTTQTQKEKKKKKVRVETVTESQQTGTKPERKDKGTKPKTKTTTKPTKKKKKRERTRAPARVTPPPPSPTPFTRACHLLLRGRKGKGTENLLHLLLKLRKVLFLLGGKGDGGVKGKKQPLRKKLRKYSMSIYDALEGMVPSPSSSSSEVTLSCLWQVVAMAMVTNRNVEETLRKPEDHLLLLHNHYNHHNITQCSTNLKGDESNNIIAALGSRLRTFAASAAAGEAGKRGRKTLIQTYLDTLLASAEVAC